MLCQFEGCEKRVKITDLSCRCEKTFCKITNSPKITNANMIIENRLRDKNV